MCILCLSDEPSEKEISDRDAERRSLLRQAEDLRTFAVYLEKLGRGDQAPHVRISGMDMVLRNSLRSVAEFI